MPFDHIELLSKLDFAPVEVQEDVNVKGVADLVGFAEELLVAVVGPSFVLQLPLGTISIKLKSFAFHIVVND